jgi:hypothetical protein
MADDDLTRLRRRGAGRDDTDLDSPPRPDATTYLPFPPPSPGYHGPDRAGSAPTSEHVPSPPGMGPPVVHYRESRRAGFGHYTLFFALLVLLFTIMSLSSGDGLRMLTYWPIVALIIITPYMMTAPLSYRTVSAGADWFAWTPSKRWWTPWTPQPHYIKTYQLTKIDGYTPTWSRPHLRLRDADGHELDAAISLYQGDRRAWDLLANGVLHSVADGATITHEAVNLFRLASHPALHGANIV